MPGDPTLGAPATVLAYNGDSARGWNDPPTFAFSANKGGTAKPKIDLRKRVSHQEALGGIRQATAANPTLSYAANNGASEALSAMNISAPGPMQQPFMLAATTSASVHSPVTSQTPPYGRPTSTASVMPPAPITTPPNSNTAVTDPANHTSHIGQPLFSVHNHQYEPVRTADAAGNIRSTAEISHLDDSSQGFSGTMPQIFHPVLSSETSGPQPAGYHGNLQPVRPVGQVSPAPFVPPAFHAQSVTPVTNPAQPQFPIGQAMPPSVAPIVGAVGHVTPPPFPARSVTPVTNPSQPQFPIGQTMPPSSAPLVGAVGHVTPPPYQSPAVTPVTNPTQPPFPIGQGMPLPVGHVTPPPPKALTPPVVSSTNGSKSSSPRSGSPANQESSDDSGTEMDDEEGLKATLDALEDVIDKYQDSLSKRVVDDLNKRLLMMSQRWRDNKLSRTVKRKMVKLAETLDNGNSKEAHDIHVQLMVNYVSEVNQWMVGVKRLISLVDSMNGTVQS